MESIPIEFLVGLVSRHQGNPIERFSENRLYEPKLISIVDEFLRPKIFLPKYKGYLSRFEKLPKAKNLQKGELVASVKAGRILHRKRYSDRCSFLYTCLIDKSIKSYENKICIFEKQIYIWSVVHGSIILSFHDGNKRYERALCVTNRGAYFLYDLIEKDIIIRYKRKLIKGELVTKMPYFKILQLQTVLEKYDCKGFWRVINNLLTTVDSLKFILREGDYPE